MPPGGPDPDFYRNLGIAAAFFIGLSSLVRLVMSLRTVFRKQKEVNGFSEWAWVALGTFVSILEPWNGSLVSLIMKLEQKMRRTHAVHR